MPSQCAQTSGVRIEQGSRQKTLAKTGAVISTMWCSASPEQARYASFCSGRFAEARRELASSSRREHGLAMAIACARQGRSAAFKR